MATPERRARQLSELLQSTLDAHHRGDVEAAAAGYEHILAIVPTHAATLDFYGALLLRQGEFDRARLMLERAVSQNPRLASAQERLGSLNRVEGNLRAAADCFRAATAANPQFVEAWLNGISAVADLDQRDEAVALAYEAVSHNPGDVRLRIRLGLALSAARQYADAAVVFRKARDIDPTNLDALLQAARNHAAIGEHEKVLEEARRALILAPARIEFYSLLKDGTAFSGARIDGVKWAARATRIRPSDVRLWNHLAAEHSLQKLSEKSVRCSMRVQVLDPTERVAHLQFGIDLYRCRLLTQSKRACLRGLVLYPDYAELKLVLSEIEAAFGNMAESWAYFDARLHPRLSPSHIEMPLVWDGVSPLEGSVLVAAEQGIGDEYVYLSYLPHFVKKVPDLVVECDARNLSLFRRSLPQIDFIPRQLRADESGRAVFDYSGWPDRHRIDRSIMAGSLPGLFLDDPTIPGPKGGYLRVDAAESAVWKEWLETLGPKPKIGICWRSGLVSKVRSTFFCTAADLIRSIGADSAEFVNLVYHATEGELEDVESEFGIKLHSPPFIDQQEELDRVAAMVWNLDCVVGMATAVTYLSSAVGTKVVQLGWSRFYCADGYDAVFGDRYPTTGRFERFNMKCAIERAGTITRDLLAHRK